jgi:hypothetical protein
VLRAEVGVEADLRAEGNDFSATLGYEETQRVMSRFIELGGQTEAGERRLGELVGELWPQADR